MTVQQIERSPMPQRRTPVTALSVPVATRDEINAVALELSVQAGARVSMARVVRAALQVAREHPDELRAAIEDEEEG